MKEAVYMARLVAWDTAISALTGFECDPGDSHAKEENRQAKLLADQLEKKCQAWLKTVKVEK